MALNRAFLLALFTVIITVLLPIQQSEAQPAPAPASHGVGIHENCMNGYVLLLVAMLFAFLVRP